MDKRIVIIDGNSLINRAYYAMQRPMMTKDGIYTHAIYGFLNMLNKIKTDYEPEYMAVAWDLKAPTFRHKEYKEYKAGRKKMPMELAMQLPYMHDILDALKIPNLSLEGYEADDIIGTIAKAAEKEELSPLIITGDKDALQLSGKKTKVLITKKGISEFDLYDYDKMLERYELTPEQFIDLKGLMGDQSDNIPGIPGVGEKTGINLLKEFGSIDGILENVDEISSEKLKNKIKDNANLALMSRRLAEIQTDVPIDISFKDFKVQEPDYEKLIDLYSKLEFNSFLKKLNIYDKKDNGNTTSTLRNETPIKLTIHEISDEKDLKKIKLKNNSEIVIKVFSDDNHIDVPVIEGIALAINNDYYYIHGILANGFIELCNSTNPIFIGHGLIRDGYPLAMNGLGRFKVGFDTEISSYLLDSAKSSYSLKALLMENFHVDIKDEKDFKKEIQQLDLLGDGNNKLKEYGLEICQSILRLRSLHEDEISCANLSKVLYEVELPLVEVLTYMECEGFKIDRVTLTEIGDKLKKEIDKLTTEIYKLSDAEFNINSPKQLGDILFNKLGLTSGKKTKSGYSTNAETLEKIKDEHPIVPAILNFRALSKLNGTYIDGLIPLIGNDERIRAHFQQTVTATGRISCTEPNLQNIPIRTENGRLIRKAFIPSDKNHVLIGADYSQIELRVLAHLSNDPSLIDAFNNNEDIHRATASKVFDIPYDKVTSEDRSKAKAVNFGVIYGMSGFGLSEELGIARWEAEDYINDYFDKHPKVKKYMDGEKDKCKESGYTETILGRRRYIPEINSSNYMVRSLGERLAMNSPIQGSAADIIKIAMIKVFNELSDKNMKSKLILQVHDELIIDTDNNEIDKVKELLIRNMMEAMTLKVSLESELNQGSSWYELK